MADSAYSVKIKDISEGRLVSGISISVNFSTSASASENAESYGLISPSSYSDARGESAVRRTVYGTAVSAPAPQVHYAPSNFVNLAPTSSHAQAHSKSLRGAFGPSAVTAASRECVSEDESGRDPSFRTARERQQQSPGRYRTAAIRPVAYTDASAEVALGDLQRSPGGGALSTGARVNLTQPALLSGGGCPQPASDRNPSPSVYRTLTAGMPSCSAAYTVPAFRPFSRNPSLDPGLEDSVYHEAENAPTTRSPNRKFPEGQIKKALKAYGYKFDADVGRGGFGYVVSAYAVADGKRVAVKASREPCQDESLMKEISLLRLLDHPNIVRYVDHFCLEGRVYLVMEYIVGGDLNKLVKTQMQKETLVDKDWIEIFQQLLAGTQALHSKNIAHRDLKPANVLMAGRTHAKIADFGLARFADPDGTCVTVCGTPLFCAPEVNLRTPRAREQRSYYGAKADIWSLGVILYFMLHARTPFDNALDTVQQVHQQRMLRGSHIEREPTRRLSGEPWKNLIALILKPVPDERPDLDTIASHRWMTWRPRT